MKELKVVLWTYPVFALSIGWAWMIFAGILHVKFGFPLFSYWESVGMFALVSWMIGSLQLRWDIGSFYNKQFIFKELI